MRNLLIILIAAAVAAPVPAVFAQTSIGEVNATTSMMNTLSGSSTGPSAAPYMDRARNVAGPVPGPSLAPPPGVMGNMNIPYPMPGMYPPGPGTMGPQTAPVQAADDRTAPPPPKPPGQHSVYAPADGFTPDQAAQFANFGFNEMRSQNFDQAVKYYEEAKRLDARYISIYNRVVEWRDRVRQMGIDEVKKVEITRDPMEITVGMYYGWTRTPEG